MIATILLLVILAIAVVTDLRWHKIYNWTTYPGILAGIGLNALATTLETSSEWGAWLGRMVGGVGLRESLLGLLACGCCMLVCFVFFRIGGGDVKLITMLGAFLGLEQGVEAMLWTFVLGGCVGVILLIWRVGLWKLLTQCVRHLLTSFRARGWLPLTPEERSQLQPPLFIAPVSIVAVVIVRFSLQDLI